MQLPVTGHPLHTRSLSMNLSLDEGGRWRAKGDVLDLRKTGFAAMPTHLQPAGIIHHMKLDLLIHPGTLRIESLEASLPVMAVEPSERSCGECCKDPVDNLKALEGERLEAGFSKKLSLAFGGALGCSHLLALFHFMAAAVPQALELERDPTDARRANGRKQQMAARKKKKKAGKKKAGELIISKSRTKRATKKCNVGAEFYGALDAAVRELIAGAEARALGNKRKTLKAVDL